MNNQELNRAMTAGIMRVEQIVHIATQGDDNSQSRAFDIAFGSGGDGVFESMGIKPKFDYWEPWDVYTTCRGAGKLGFLVLVAFPTQIFLERGGFNFHHEEVYERWFYGETLEEAYQKAFDYNKESNGR